MITCPECRNQVPSHYVACENCNHIFHLVRERYADEDQAAFDRKDGSHFGFPHTNVYATVVLSDGSAKFTQQQALTQHLGIRYFKSEAPNCWIWGERYVFADCKFPPHLDLRDFNNAKSGYSSFLDRFDFGKRVEIAELATTRGLNPNTKTDGKPDLAIYSPQNAIPWRFVELKRGDDLDLRQRKWLNVLAKVMGTDAVFVIELYSE